MCLLHLLRNGADVNARDTFGNTPIAHAVKSGHEAATLTLLQKGADMSVIIDDPAYLDAEQRERDESRRNNEKEWIR